jgi:anti-sigma B factor antagonist
MRGFRITTTQIQPDLVVVALSGEVDMNAAPDFGDALTTAVDSSPRFVVIDLGNTTFIDSTALRVLMQGRKRLEALGGGMSIVCPNRLVWKIFEITGLVDLFPRYSTLDEAVGRQTAKDARTDADGLGVAAVSISPVL